MLTAALLLLATSPLLGAAGPDDPDLLTLSDGKQVECRVLFEDDARVIYRARRKVREVARDEVAEVQSIERSLRAYLEHYDRSDPTNVASLVDLALFAERSDLPSEARNTWIRVLTLDPENEQAWTRLGGTQGRKGWRLKVRGRFYTLDELRERVGDWKNAMELPTAHFLIRTDIAPERALDIALEVERITMAYYDLLGPALTLYPFDEIPEIQIYKSADDYPKPPAPGRRAWYARNANVLYVDASAEIDRVEVYRNFTYCLLFNSFRRSLDTRTGGLPPWAREGMAEVFARALVRADGRSTVDVGVPFAGHFEQIAGDADPLSLQRIVSADLAAFEGGSNQARYRAQAYALVYFLANANGGEHRAGFAEYLRSAFVGKGAATHLEKALGVRLKDLETEFGAYVREVAGG